LLLDCVAGRDAVRLAATQQMYGCARTSMLVTETDPRVLHGFRWGM
jgi:hypothetical protein